MLLSYNTAVKKFMHYWTKENRGAFQLPATAKEICEFCFWAGQNDETQTPQEVTAKTVEKYIFGIQAWHKYHSKRYPTESKTRVGVILRALAKVDAQIPKQQPKAAVHLHHLAYLASALNTGDGKDEAAQDLAITAL
ncbi:hypothetical protein PCANC_00094 [Puccinia coronata f. sp. avenae]|uniref:Uncharacterized protein n=1 Tax=Puccinia coronata f. sp. avenae TaxID=200324 RepID=A0A2N5V8R0_9BASI|nr:hypothetical protein PCANC_06369 [Puccinia coronata f. sp. avenae]PLW19568.1 hypothetical protein PCASD_21094 [Puccinia coronata f. sp. avenae]PLW46387.1 hypothetical protein PCASD_05457 [Puccinia coronata f. sp. avenae]PLW58589.1 hypothetical protein PCANC_00094 [Puccinia coronata f. sp. avenae]